jgi:bacillithiol biosynthesis cysteine-adding enzyme BshC
MDSPAFAPSQLPHTSKLFIDFIENFPKLKSFYPHAPTFDSIAAYAKTLDYPAPRRREVTEILRVQNISFGCSPQAETNLQRLQAGAVAVVSGQQVGLFGGPGYALYKAISAIQAASDLTAAGIDAVPIFWMASEDHDVDEVRHVDFFSDGKLHHFELPRPEVDAVPVGNISLGSPIEEVVAQTSPLLTGPDGAALAEVLRKNYIQPATYSSSFASLFAQIFAEQGLILLDPLDKKLHRVAAPILRAALAEREPLNEALLRRGKELEHAGYDAQVNVTARSTLLFWLDGGKRQVISTNSNGKFIAGEHAAPAEEWLRQVEVAPEKFSPNALLRPVVQDFLLPTAAYFGGPAEIAYFAQSSVLYEKLLGRMPVLMPRADFTLVDPKAERILKKYGLQVQDVWQGQQELLKRMYGTNLPVELSNEFETSVGHIEEHTEKLFAAIGKVDPTIREGISRSEKRIRYQLEKVRRKIGASLDRHENVIAGHAAFLENLLFPHKGLQSRDLSFLPFLARWGSAGILELQKLASTKTPWRHRVISIP